MRQGEIVTQIEKVARLRELLFGLEKDIGIHNMSSVKQNILYATALLDGRIYPVETEALRNHPLLLDVTRSTFFNALKALVEEKHLKHVDGYKRSQYLLCDLAVVR